MLRYVDAAGVAVSSICAVHCALTPVVLLLLPLAGASHLESTLRIIAVTIAVLAVGGGAFFHRNFKVLPPLGIGIGILLLALRMEPGSLGDIVLSILASGALIAAHVLNTRACRRSGHDCAPAQALANIDRGDHGH
jgi:hypothetical protein